MRYGTLLALALAVLVFSVLKPHQFPSVNNAVIILKQGAVLTVVAVGLTVALILGDFDLSIGPVAGLAGVLAAGFIIQTGLATPAAIALALGAAAVVGALNGVFVAYIRVSAFIATLGMSSVVAGGIFWYTGGAPVRGVFPVSFYALGRGSFLGVPAPVLIMLAYAFVLWVLLNHTALGRHMKAVGGSSEVARLAGVAVARVRILSFMISAVSAGLAGVLLAATLGLGHPQAGDGLLLDAFAAAFLGAVTFRRGEFNIAGTVVAVILVSVVTNGLTMAGSPVFIQQMLKGGILLAAVSMQSLDRLRVLKRR